MKNHRITAISMEECVNSMGKNLYILKINPVKYVSNYYNEHCFWFKTYLI